MFTTMGSYRVQNFELYLILKNCFKNNRFLEFYPKWLNIVNPISYLMVLHGIWMKDFVLV